MVVGGVYQDYSCIYAFGKSDFLENMFLCYGVMLKDEKPMQTGMRPVSAYCLQDYLHAIGLKWLRRGRNPQGRSQSPERIPGEKPRKDTKDDVGSPRHAYSMVLLVLAREVSLVLRYTLWISAPCEAFFE